MDKSLPEMLSKMYMKTACCFIGTGIILVGATAYRAFTTKFIGNLGVSLYSIGMMSIGAGCAAAGNASGWKKVEKELNNEEVN